MFVTSGLFAFKGVTTVVIWRRNVLRRAQAFTSLALVMSLAGCPGGSDTVGTSMPSAPHPAVGLRLEQVNTSLSFPLFLTAPSNDMLRLFVVEKGGRIKILDRATGAVIATFLDISNLVSTGSEQGLLGLAFDPQYNSNRRFYVSYTDTSGNTVIARYLVSVNNPNLAVGTADQVIFTVAQPFANHNGGMITFGSDGLLYIALGDGGSGGDPGNRAQDMSNLLGKLLRIDIDIDDFPTDPTSNYGIPPTNPFVGQIGVRGEIWSSGLRNPWRFSFDRQTGDLYIADVGQGAWEEVNASSAMSGAGKGINYGWRIMEGMHCFNPPSGCNMTGLTLPVVEYDHPTGCSVTGGYVYRGSAITALRGTYFYGDFCAGFVRSFRLGANGSATEEAGWPTLGPGGQITSFGEDAMGELYIMTSGGGLFRIVPN